MKFYYLNDSVDINIIGKDYPQIQHTESKFDYLLPNHYNKLNHSIKAEYSPLFDIFLVQYRCKLTDNLSTAFLGREVLVISEKLMKLIEKQQIENYYSYEVNIRYHKKNYKYYYFYIYDEGYEYIDTLNSIFYIKPLRGGMKKNRVLINDNIELKRWKIENLSKNGASAEKIVLNSKTKHADMFRIPYFIYGSGGYFVSQNFYDVIINENITGFEFIELDNIILENQLKI